VGTTTTAPAAQSPTNGFNPDSLFPSLSIDTTSTYDLPRNTRSDFWSRSLANVLLSRAT
jgi:hypothetical protein